MSGTRSIATTQGSGSHGSWRKSYNCHFTEPAEFLTMFPIFSSCILLKTVSFHRGKVYIAVW